MREGIKRYEVALKALRVGDKGGGVVSKVRYGGSEFDIEYEFKRIKLMYELIQSVRVEDDYIAAGWAYEYLLPRVNALLRYIDKGENFRVRIKGDREEWSYYSGYIASNEERARVLKWGSSGSEMTLVKQGDGCKKQVSYIEYLYKEIRVGGMAIAGRWYMHYNLQYLELDKRGEKSYPNRMRVLRSAVWWCNQMLMNIFGKKMIDGGEYSDIQPSLIVFSTMPSSGKSFVCNTMNEMFSVLAMIIQKKGGVLRVGNEQNNILEQSRQTIGLLLNPLIIDIYPELAQYVKAEGKTTKFQPFDKAAAEEWSLKGTVFTPTGTIFKTRDSAINSVRCQLGMFDDPSRGQQESSNMAVHGRICNLFYGDFQDRFESQSKRRILLTGTMFNPEDVFSKAISNALGDGKYTTDTRFRNTYISSDKKTIVIVNDCENEYGESAFPEFISTKDLHERRDSLPEYDYRCIWRQRPIPADGLIFSKEFLSFYDELPPANELSDYAYAVIDPTRRKAKDFFSMPIFKYHSKSDKYYLIDIIYQRKSVLQLYDKIVKKILNHRIIQVGYEENTDTSLGVAIKAHLKDKDPNALKWCNLQQIYSTTNKLRRINDMAGTIIQNMMFPSAKIKSAKTEIGFAVHTLTNFDGDGGSGNDDFPDSLAMFADMFIVNANKTNYIIPHKNRPF